MHRLLWKKQELHKDDLGLESCDSWHSAVSLLKLNPLHEISNVHIPLQVSGEELGEDKMTDFCIIPMVKIVNSTSCRRKVNTSKYENLSHSQCRIWFNEKSRCPITIQTLQTKLSCKADFRDKYTSIIYVRNGYDSGT